MTYTYEYPRPMVTVDAIIYKKTDIKIEILLIKRGNNPFINMWALPGGFVDMDEDLIDAVKRETEEETNLIIDNFRQFKTYGKQGRDPRGRNISIVFYAQVSKEVRPKHGDDASDVEWFDLNSLPELAFDHSEIINEWTKLVIEAKQT
jgi:8-oxo-dGTP diphosphatase